MQKVVGSNPISRFRLPLQKVEGWAPVWRASFSG